MTDPESMPAKQHLVPLLNFSPAQLNVILSFPCDFSNNDPAKNTSG